MDMESPRHIAAALGITPELFEAKKDFLLIGDEDLANIAAIRESIPDIPETMFDSFYEHLMRFEQTRTVFSGNDQVAALKEKQRKYFSQLLSGRYDFEYMLNRLHVGNVHCKLNIVPLWYIGSFSKYMFGIIDTLDNAYNHNSIDVFSKFKSLLKVIMLDIIITLDSYHYGKYKMQIELERISVTDQLTGLMNVRKFNEVIVHEFSRSARNDYGLALLFLDIDGFKGINDTLGHSAGNRVLVSLAGLLKDSVRVHDYVFRYGGEEFLVLLPDTNLEQALQVGEKLRARVAGHKFENIECITISIGVAMRTPGDTVEDLVSRADNSMYEAKRSGKNQVCCLGES